MHPVPLDVPPAPALEAPAAPPVPDTGAGHPCGIAITRYMSSTGWHCLSPSLTCEYWFATVVHIVFDAASAITAQHFVKPAQPASELPNRPPDGGVASPQASIKVPMA